MNLDSLTTTKPPTSQDLLDVLTAYTYTEDPDNRLMNKISSTFLVIEAVNPSQEARAIYDAIVAIHLRRMRWRMETKRPQHPSGFIDDNCKWA